MAGCGPCTCSLETSDAVADTLREEATEANEIIDKLGENTPLEGVSETVVPTAPVPALDTLVTPPEIDTLVTPPIERPHEEVVTETSKELLAKLENNKKERDDSDMYSIKNFGV